MLHLPMNLARLAGLAAENPGHYSLTAVRLDATPKGYRAEVTDGRRLARVDGTSLPAAEAYSALPAMPDAPDGQTSVLVPATAWAAAFQVVRQRTGNTSPACVAALLGKDMTTLAAIVLGHTNAMQIRNLDGPYPNTDAAFPTGKPAAVVRLDVRWLQELLDLAAAFADTVSARAAVTLEVHLPQRESGSRKLTPAPLVLRASNPTLGQEFTGILMPLI
jgi:hypothetical protein